ncbi:hypothetical protein KP509_04G108800 [Ceratopteris richardii]|uniref:EF-hand domain-containing protein n=1 Tax=Ceratopteris richardii TaxID=49495 RepID=A0A8T2UZ18_CERRI|nr:hypothetical protein KP509_04G108800 [Ceratopteris richardii]
MFQMAITNKDDPQLLHCIFQIFDENGDGCVSVDEVLHILEKLGMETSKSSIHTLFSQLPRAPKDRLSKEEFHELYETIWAPAHESEVNDSAILCNSDADEELIEAFHVFDRDRDGFISPTELQAVLRSLGFLQANHLSACVEMIERADQNGDCRVDFKEFKRMFTSHGFSS